MYLVAAGSHSCFLACFLAALAASASDPALSGRSLVADWLAAGRVFHTKAFLPSLKVQNLKFKPVSQKPTRIITSLVEQQVLLHTPVRIFATGSAMSAGDSNFEVLLTGLLSHDNAVRRNAESVFTQNLETQAALVVAQLLRCLSGQVSSRTCLLQRR